MSPKLQALLSEAQELTAAEQMELIARLTELLNSEESAKNSFWQATPLSQLIANSAAKPVESFKDLQSEFWPENETADEFLSTLASQRKEDSLH